MSKRIGEALIEKELITSGQLTRALQAQLIFGGHLGTNLIEMGFVEEDAFGQTLSDPHGLPYADANRMRGIHPAAIHSFPKELADKHQAVPIELDEETLHLAVIDPQKLGALSSVTGFKIMPWIAPEIRIFEALERYYGIPRRARYIGICEELDRSGIPTSEPDSELDSGSIDPDAVGGSGSTLDDLGIEFGYGKCWTEIAGEIEPPDATAIDRQGTSIAATATIAANGAQADSILGELSDRLCAAENKEDVARAVLDHVAPATDRSILFAIKGNTARLWDWRGLKLDPDRAKGLRFPVTSGSLFTLLLGNSYFRGPVPADASCRCSYGMLGIEVPFEILLVPIYLNDRLVAVFYGDARSAAGIEGDTEDYLRPTHKVTLALSMLLLKMKLRSA